MSCEHKTLHFEGKHIAYLVCNGCGKAWERTVEYERNNRSTYYRATQKDCIQRHEGKNKLIYNSDKKIVVDSKGKTVISKIEEANMI